MKKVMLLASLLFLCGCLSGCGETYGCRTFSTGLLGAGVGAVLGGGRGALIGGASGAALGAITPPQAVYGGPSPLCM